MPRRDIKSRNLSEKKRRDQFNMLVNELCTMVSTNTRKMDKSTVLKSTISFLKNHQEIAVRSRMNEIQENWKPTFLSNEEFTHLILEALDGFIIAFSSSGMILYTSESITSLLGHLPSDIVNSSLYNLTYDDDRPLLYNILQNSEEKWDDLQDEDYKDNQVTFSCHIKRNSHESEEQMYDLVEFVGYFRKYSGPQNPMDNTGLSYRSNNPDIKIIFVCTGRLQVPQLIKEMPVIDYSNSEFTSRHSLEWKFLFLDHRAPPIIGYLPFEVLGTSGYDYYHFDDLENVISCHEALMQKGEGTSCYYRFLTKGQQWIWLQTRFYITYHQWNSKPEFVVCTHRVVSSVDEVKTAKNECPQVSKVEDYNTENEKKSVTYNHDNVSIYSAKNASYSNNSSNWSKMSNSSRYNSNTNDFTNSKRKYRQSSVLSPGQNSDTGSMSAESIISKQSSNTHGSTYSRENYNRKENSSTFIMNTYPQSQYQVESIHEASQYPPQPANLLLHAPVHNPQFIDPTQYTLPVPPVIGIPQIPGIPASPDMSILITPAQAQIQEQLQKKHEELQQMIIQQQEELRRVSEQLVMARYGLLPPIINVPVPFSIQNSSVSGVTPHLYTPGMPAIPPRAVVEPVIQNENNEYIPMQMSQQQAQLLFSSPNHSQSYTREM